jgi:hypothetical protein
MSATLLANTTLNFSAGPGTPVTWSIVEAADAGPGMVTAQGAYTAPPNAGTYHLRASSGGHTATAAITVVKTVTPVTIVGTGELPTATGHGSQRHLAYAQGTGQWWLFHDPTSPTNVLAATYSNDFGNWTSGGNVALTNDTSGDGRDLTVAYRSINGHDVVHISQGYHYQKLGRYHIRALLKSGAIQFENPIDINYDESGQSIPDGPATAILANGLVVDGTGQTTTPDAPPLMCGFGDFNVYTSAVLDDGTTNFSQLSAFNQDQVLWCIGSISLARQILVLGNVAVHLAADGEPPANILTNLRPDVPPDAGVTAWLPVEPYGQADAGTVPLPAVFATPSNFYFDRNDWTAAVRNGVAHAVLRTQNGTFEHRIMSMDASGPNWQPGGTFSSTLSTPPGSGLVLVPYADSLLLLAISSDGHIEYSAYDDISTSWSAWVELCMVPSSANYLSGFAPESGPKPAIIWTEAAGDAGYGIAGALLP